MQSISVLPSRCVKERQYTLLYNVSSRTLVLVLWHAASNEGRKKRTVGCAARRKLFTNINSSKYTINSIVSSKDRYKVKQLLVHE